MSAERPGFFDALVSEGPHASIPVDARVFEPLIGKWSLVVTWFAANGGVSRRERGEWHFAWVLEGRAVQDVWIVPPRHDRSQRTDLYEYGSSLRFYDSQTGVWQSTWIGPMHGVVRTFVARRIDGSIVLDTTAGHEPRLRWSFSGIRANSFDWTNEIWENGAWRIQQAFQAQRR